MHPGFYICSLKWSTFGDNVLTWWRPDARGYTSYLEDAGVFTADEVEYFCGNDGTNAIMFRKDIVDRYTRTAVPDFQLVHICKAMEKEGACLPEMN